MGVQEYVTYGLAIAAVFALVWALFGRGDGIGGGAFFAGDRENGWERLPGIFKFIWVIAVTYETPLGTSLSDRFHRKAARLNELALASALPLNPARVFCSSVFLGLIFGFIGLAAGSAAACAVKWNWWIALPVGLGLVFFLMGWYWPMVNLKDYAMRRREQLRRQMPFAIDLITSAMRSGLEFGAAVRYYVDCGVKGALQEELARVLDEVQVGKSFAEALENMSGRIGLPAFTSFADAVAYGQEVGAPISQTLKIQGAELQRSRFALAEQKAARAPQLMILPLIVFIMPSVFIVMLTPLVIQFMKMTGH